MSPITLSEKLEIILKTPSIIDGSKLDEPMIQQIFLLALTLLHNHQFSLDDFVDVLEKVLRILDPESLICFLPEGELYILMANAYEVISDNLVNLSLANKYNREVDELLERLFAYLDRYEKAVIELENQELWQLLNLD
jgi:hypothetical protein